jgi:hypothetical protein
MLDLGSVICEPVSGILDRILGLGTLDLGSGISVLGSKI